MPSPPPLAVLVNPRAGSVRRHLPRLRALGQSAAGKRYAECSKPDEMAAFVAEAAPGEDGVLCVVAGDGSLHAVLTALERQRPDGGWPLLAPAPGGTTNMTARVLGKPGRATPYLTRLARWVAQGGASVRSAAPGRIVPLPVLRIARTDTGNEGRDAVGEGGGAGVLAGMFLGAGAVAAGVELFHSRFKPWGTPEVLATPAIAARILASLALRRTLPAEMSSPARLEVDGVALPDHRALLLVVSTLHRLLLGARPYWGSGEGPIHATLIERHVRWGAADLWHFMRGNPTGRLTPELGWHSHDAHRIRLALDGPYVVDGEAYRVGPGDAPLEVTAPRLARWWMP